MIIGVGDHKSAFISFIIIILAYLYGGLFSFREIYIVVYLNGPLIGIRYEIKSVYFYRRSD